MAPIGLQSECRVSQATKVAHSLPICGTSELRLVEDGFLKLGVRNLAIGHGCMSAAPGEQGNDKDSFGESSSELPCFAAGGFAEMFLPGDVDGWRIQ